MKSSKRRTLKIKTEQCARCLHNKPERAEKGLDPCICPTGIEIRNGICRGMLK
jgi:polyferredoxin